MDEIKLIFAGDFCVRGAGVDNLTDEKIDEISGTIAKKTSECDISIVNVETVFTEKSAPVKKSGPALLSPIKALSLLEKMGFDAGAFANNHVCDQGREIGLESISRVRKAGMLTFGCGENLDAANAPLRFEKKGKKISIFNFAENEFTAAGETTFGFAPIDYYTNGNLVRSEKTASDYVFVMLHAGNETCPFPRSGVRKLARHLVESGADGVVISHPHTPQGYEYYMGKPIVYSLGNFFMTKRNDKRELWNLGYMAELTISDNGISIKPIPYEFAPYGEWFKFLSGDEKVSFDVYLKTLCRIISDTESSSYKKLEYAWSILYMKAVKDGFLKENGGDMTHDGELMLFTKNAFCCESHLELMQNFFTVLTTNRLDEFEEEKKKIHGWQKVPF